MKFCLLLVLIGCLVHQDQAAIEQDLNLFKEKIDGKCLSRLWSNPSGPKDFRPERLTMESFIGLVEKVEQKHSKWDVFQTSRALLERFALEEIVFKQIGGSRVPAQTDTYRITLSIMSKLLPDDHFAESFKETDLTETEKCNMFFMMAHLVNSTARQGFESGATMPREQGVVNLKGNGVQAVSLSRLLYAILASQQTKEPYVNELFNIKHPSFPQNQRINSLIGVTFGEILSLAALYEKPGTAGRGFFGLAGNWNSITNPSEYNLKNESIHVSNALLNGAVDGFLLGNALKELLAIEKNKSFRLSTLLRDFYSLEGTKLPKAKSPSYCERHNVTDIVKRTLISNSALSYYYVLVYKEFSHVFPNSEYKINQAIKEMEKALLDMSTETDEECGRKKLPEASTLIGPVSKATLFCKEFFSLRDMIGEVTVSGCKVMCLTSTEKRFLTVPNGMTCDDGKGTCNEGDCVKEMRGNHEKTNETTN